MTDKQKELVKELFDYGCRDGFKDYQYRAFLKMPERIEELKDCQHYDLEAERLINSCKLAIETMQAYRAALFERYNVIATTPTVPVVKLTRERKYYREGNIYYYLRTYRRNLETGKDLQVESKEYSGKQRHEAIKAFNDYVKSHPGIINEMDIAKREWER